MNKSDEQSGTNQVSVQAAKRWRWYHGLLFYVIAQVLSFGLNGLVTVARSNGRKSLPEAVGIDNTLYKRQHQPKFAPPAWAFGPAWTINNISVIYGNLRALNAPKGTPGREAYLALQALSWVDYALFSAAYFGLRSPINGAVVTLSMFGLTVASLAVSLFRLKDSKVALSLATLFLWLCLASPLSIAVALWNRDDFYGAGPFTRPAGWLLK